MKKKLKLRAAMVAALVALAQAAPLGLAQSDFVQAVKPSASALRSMMLDVAAAGERIVAVGEQGYILLSDDGGKTVRQAKSVPVSLTLTGVSFTDAKHGWAVGHGSTILHTSDGGETWVEQYRDKENDQPLLSVYFADEKHGWAAGIWSILMVTEDGGRIWNRMTLQAPANRKRADVNLFKVFADGPDLYIAAEQGMVLHSSDSGKKWSYITTGYAGSLWAGATSVQHTLLVGGLRGKMLRSTDSGKTWQPVDTPLRGSVTQLRTDGKRIWAAGLDGGAAYSDDDGVTWNLQRTSPLPVTTFGLASTQPLLFTRQGPLTSATTQPQ